MSSVDPTPEQAVEAVYQYAAEQMRNGVPYETIRNDLVSKGLDAESASAVVEQLDEARTKIVRESGRRNMLIGGLICVAGIAVTAVTYSMASGGGSYVVAWGAIVFGGIQFLRGLGELN